MTTDHSSSVLLTEEEKNTSFDFTKPGWDIVRQVEGRVHHRLVSIREQVTNIFGYTNIFVDLFYLKRFLD